MIQVCSVCISITCVLSRGTIGAKKQNKNKKQKSHPLSLDSQCFLGRLLATSKGVKTNLRQWQMYSPRLNCEEFFAAVFGLFEKQESAINTRRSTSDRHWRQIYVPYKRLEVEFLLLLFLIVDFLSLSVSQSFVNPSVFIPADSFFFFFLFLFVVALFSIPLPRKRV